MFGSKKIQELEARLRELEGQLSQETARKNELTQSLESANRRIAELEEQLNDFDLERLKKEASASHAEYEGLKELYARKNREFDESREEKEQTFAREAALQRHNLENEIRDNRQANQDYVASTVRTFGESYNYYLNQIRLLMDALGEVAARTGETLFSGDNGDLRSRFGSQMRDKLRNDAGSLRGDEGDVVVIGNGDEAEDAPASAAEYEALFEDGEAPDEAGSAPDEEL